MDSQIQSTHRFSSSTMNVSDISNIYEDDKKVKLEMGRSAPRGVKATVRDALHSGRKKILKGFSRLKNSSENQHLLTRYSAQQKKNLISIGWFMLQSSLLPI